MILAWSGILSKRLDNENLAFRVLQLTDIHIQNNTKEDNKTFDTIDMMIEKSNPNLIIITGDITSEQDNMPAFETFCSFIEGYNIPWAFTFGNHDAEGAIGKEELANYLLTLKNCVFEKGPADVDGSGYHYINVPNKEGKVVMSLLMMDSNMYYAVDENTNDGYDKFHDNQIAWYEKTIKSIAKEVNGDENKMVNSLAFFHIPMQEFENGYKKGKKLYGYKLEDVYCSKYEDNMFEKMVELGSTKGCFVGHDHMNNYAVEYKGIRLTYGYSTDHNLYLVPQRGGTIINIKNDGTFTQQGIFRNSGVGKLIINKAV